MNKRCQHKLVWSEVGNQHYCEKCGLLRYEIALLNNKDKNIKKLNNMKG